MKIQKSMCRRAKIIATLGPASSDPDTILSLCNAGVDVFRLNFSHGSHEEHALRHNIIREIEWEIKRPIGILQDLQGPKIRIGKVRGGKVNVNKGDTVSFVHGEREGDIQKIPIPHSEVFENIAPGHFLLIDDGRLRLQITGIHNDHIEAQAMNTGVLSDRKGINLPDTVLKLSPLTPKDREDLEFGLKLGMDWVALSFVQSPSDMLEARQYVGQKAGLVAKIEKPSALEKMDDIIRLSDAIMVARGDLGVEIPPEEVPGRQKELVRACRLVGKPVFVATQMLDSMTYSPTPTRAEASDVATAIYDGADGVMLSQETAAGSYPVEAVEMMARIINRTEKHQDYRAIIEALEPIVASSIHHSISEAAADIANAINASAIVAFTASGATALRISRKRPAVPIMSITPSNELARKLALLWGTYSISSPDIEDYNEMVDRAIACAINNGFAKAGDKVVIIAGIPFGVSGSTNNIRVVTVN